MRYCSVKNLNTGMILARPVISGMGSVLLQANIKLTYYTIERLRVLGTKGVYILDDISSDVVDRSNLPINLQVQALDSISSMDIDSIVYIANSLIDNLQNIDIINTDLSALSSFDEYTYMHSVNVATYCAILGLKLGLDYTRLVDLTTAAMLHDIGKVKVPLEILNKPGRLTDEERVIINRHPGDGYDMLKENSSVKSVVRVSVLEHHENWDGSGYPNGFKGEDIYFMARIIHVCDVYDALISERVYKPAKPPHEVVEYMLAFCDKMFERRIVREFISSLNIYPDGTIVRLSDNANAIVVRNNMCFPLRPVVRRLTDGVELDLLHYNDIVIEDYVFE